MRHRLTLALLIVPLVLLLLPSAVTRAADPVDTSLSSTNYGDIDNTFVPASAPWDWEAANAPYTVRVKEDFTAGQILEFGVGSSTVRIQPMALEWTNDLGMIQQVSMPQDVSPSVTDPDGEGTITWDNAYGLGIDFQWQSTPVRVDKILTIGGLSDLPSPAQYIQDGGNAVLRLNLIFAPSSDVGIYVNDQLWNKSSKQLTFNEIEFRKNGEVLWNFMPLLYWDSEGNEGQSVATLEKRGNKLYISIRVPYEWLQSAVYPVFIDADIAIETSVQGNLNEIAVLRGGPFWTSPTVGYVLFIAGGNLKYRKTADGGATWGAAVNIRGGGAALVYDSWADWQTAGDPGTKINITYLDLANDGIRYVYLDTDGDSVGGDDEIEASQGTGQVNASGLKGIHFLSITKTRGGNIVVAARYQDTNNTEFFSFHTSPDGDTWTGEASPWEGQDDYILLFPGNEADNQDVWATFWDKSADTISLKTYDDSGDSWSEQVISGSMIEDEFALQMDGAIRLSDGHLIFAAWTRHVHGTSDLKVWDINGAGSITAKTNVLTDKIPYFLVSVFVNQANDDIYAAYVGGPLLSAEVAALYQKSTDGGGSWDGETAMQADAEDRVLWISAGAAKKAWGGKFQPVWYNDALFDLLTNVDNGISIAAVSPPTVTTQAATSIEDTTATGNGNITATGGENADVRGIVWDLATHGDPGNVAPGASGYANDVSQGGSFGTGAFTRSLTGLPTGDIIYVRAYAHNAEGYAYGSEVNFLTKPAAPTNVAATDGSDETKVVITWTKSTGATDYHVFRGVTDLGAAGDVATFDDSGATAATITDAGTVTASDGSSIAHVTLSLAGESTGTTVHSYTVVASNVTGDSDASSANNGNRGVGAITYQWQRSAADSDAAYGDIGGATTDPYNDTAAPAPTVTPGTASASDGSSTAHVTLSVAGESANIGAGRFFQAIVSASGASNSPQTSDNNRGHRSVGGLTYQWRRSAGDADAGFGNIGGATTDPYNDSAAPAGTVSSAGTATASDGASGLHVTLSLAGEVTVDGAGRWYYVEVSATGATTQDSTHNRGFRTTGAITYQWQRSAADSDASYGNIGGATTDPYNDTGAPEFPAGRFFRCVISSVDASNSPQTSTSDRGFRAVGPSTVTTQAATSIEDTTATGNGNITATGGENADRHGIVWDLATQGAPGNVAPGASGYANDVGTNGGFGTGAFTDSLTGLPTGDTIYARAYAHNSAGYTYGAEINFLTKPAAPTNVAATDGSETSKVVITWTKSTGATDYHVFRGVTDLGAAGDVATFDDSGADAGVITPGTATASDGTIEAHVVLSLAGESTADGTVHTYTVVASNVTGDSDVSSANSGNRGIGAITYQWQRSAADSDAAFGDIGGGTTDPYNDTAAPANGDGRWFLCLLDAAGATQAESTHERGFRGTKHLVLYIDEVEEDVVSLSGESVPDNANDWVIMDNNTTPFVPYSNNFVITVSGSDVLQYQPTDIIETTQTLGTADSGTATTLVDAILTEANDFWNNATLRILTTTDTFAPQGEVALVSDFDAGTDTLTFPALTAAVGTGDTYVVEFGTVLDEIGSVDGKIAWGQNPSGVTTAMAGLISDFVSGAGATGISTQDILPDLTPPVTTNDAATLAVIERIPGIFPLTEVVASLTGIPIILQWQGGLMVLAILAFVLIYARIPNFLLAGAILSAVIGVGVMLTVFEFWVIAFIIVFMIGMALLQSRLA